MHRLIPVLSVLLLWPSTLLAFDFSGYGKLLDTYLVENQRINGIPANLIDYDRWHKEQLQPGSDYLILLGQLAAFDPATLKTNDEKLAFWGNVYNIAAIKTILDHWPVDSIRSGSIHWLGQPWKRKAIRVGGRDYSLLQIEFDLMVEGLRDLRAHLAVNCASASCVDIPKEPFDTARLDAQLQASGERFFAQPEKGYRIDREDNTVYISQIFKFDRKHFKEYAGGPIPFLLNYVTNPDDKAFLQKGGYDIEYLDYDWSLNDTGGADK